MGTAMDLKSPSLVGFDDIKAAQPITGWEEFLAEGDAYLKTGMGAHAKGRTVAGATVFTPEILYNIIAMSIEKLVMATLMKRGALPYNHTMYDLVEAMDDVFPDSLAGIREGLLDLDRYQEICDIDHYNIVPPDSKEIPGMLNLAVQLQNVVYGQIEEVRV
jgi:hypothetical protein